MIVPVNGLQFYKFKKPEVEDKVTLVQEPDNKFDSKAIAVYNQRGQMMGYIGRRSGYNNKVYEKLAKDQVEATVWAIFKNQILIKIDPVKKPSPK